jgi:hypothetical protein
MNRILRCCIGAFIVCAHLLRASSDTYVPPLYSHTRFDLPPPYDKGEIIAKARLKTVGEESSNTKGTIIELLSMKVTIGSTVTNVSRPVLDLFPSPMLASLRFFVGPPDNSDFPLFSAHPKQNAPAYFNISFRYGGWSYQSELSSESYPTASITIKDGRIIGLSSCIEGKPQSKTTNFDPITLRETN